MIEQLRETVGSYRKRVGKHLKVPQVVAFKMPNDAIAAIDTIAKFTGVDITTRPKARARVFQDAVRTYEWVLREQAKGNTVTSLRGSDPGQLPEGTESCLVSFIPPGRQSQAREYFDLAREQSELPPIAGGALDSGANERSIAVHADIESYVRKGFISAEQGQLLGANYDSFEQQREEIERDHFGEYAASINREIFYAPTQEKLIAATAGEDHADSWYIEHVGISDELLGFQEIPTMAGGAEYPTPY